MTKIRIEMDIEVPDNYKDASYEIALSKAMQDAKARLENTFALRVIDCRLLESIGVL